MILLKQIVETIRAADAYNDASAIQTVIDGERDLGFITLRGSTLSKEEIIKRIKNGGLRMLSVPDNPNEAYIYYLPGARKKAEELAAIANRYGGYLSYQASADETRRIGELLGYHPDDIQSYVKQRYPGV
jgi:hypothetical protein